MDKGTKIALAALLDEAGLPGMMLAEGLLAVADVAAKDTPSGRMLRRAMDSTRAVSEMGLTEPETKLIAAARIESQVSSTDKLTRQLEALAVGAYDNLVMSAGADINAAVVRAVLASRLQSRERDDEAAPMLLGDGDSEDEQQRHASLLMLVRRLQEGR